MGHWDSCTTNRNQFIILYQELSSLRQAEHETNRYIGLNYGIDPNAAYEMRIHSRTRALHLCFALQFFWPLLPRYGQEPHPILVAVWDS